MVPHSAAIPLTVLSADSLGASYIEIGLISAAFSAAPLLLALRIGRFVDRYGIVLPVSIGASGMFVALILPYFFQELYVLFISRLLAGAAHSLVIVAMQNGTAALVDAAHRERSVTNFSLFGSAGLFLGPLSGGYLAEMAGFQTAYAALACVTVVPLVLARWISVLHGSSSSKGGFNEEERAAKKGPKKKSPNMIAEVFNNTILRNVIMISMISLTTADLFAVYFPLLGSAKGLSALDIGWIIAIEGLAFVFVRLFMPMFIGRFGRSNTLFGFLLVGGFAFAWMPFFHQFYIFALLAAVLGFGLGLAAPVTITLAYNHAPEGRSAEVLGMRIASNRLAQLTLPIVLAAISQFGGLISIFIINGLLLIAVAVIAKRIRS